MLIGKCPAVKSNRVELVPLTLGDVTPRYVEWLNDPLVNRTLLDRGRASVQSVRKYVQERLNRPDVWFWKIVCHPEKVHVGNIKLEPINVSAGTAWYGIMIGERAYWGKGVATEASRLCLRAAFRDAGLTQVFLGVYEENIAAIRVYEKSGFEQLKEPPSGCDVHSGVIYMCATPDSVGGTIDR